MMIQKNFMFLILMIVIGMLMFGDDIIFPLGFLCFVASLFTISTISYDDYDNGNAFLFTLPITRKSYVIEKYFLGIIFSCITWLVAVILGAIVTLIKDELPVIDLVQNSFMIHPYHDGDSSYHASFSAKIWW